MIAITQALIAEIEAMPTYTQMAQFLRALKSTVGQAAAIIEGSINTYELLGREANEEERSAIRIKVLDVLNGQPNTDTYMEEPTNG